MNQIQTEPGSFPLDWNQAWLAARNRKKHEGSGRPHWNRRAAGFAENAQKSNYAEQFIQMLNPQPNWSVLDVGCGAGTLAVPLSPLVRRISAIDFSENMIALLKGQRSKRGLANIRTGVIGWEDDREKAGIGVHDVAIASRSLVVDDLRAALIKLNSKARYRVYITSLVGDGPFDRRIFEAIGRDLNRGPDYIYVYNLLHQIGIHAEIRFIYNGGGSKVYRDSDDMAEKLHWMLGDLCQEESARLQGYFERQLKKTQEGWTLPTPHPVRWAVISWNKGHLINQRMQKI